MSLLEIDNLHVHFLSRDRLGEPRRARALNGVTFSLDRGEIIGLVGETGAGKSLTAQSVMGMLRPPAHRIAGTITFDGRDLATLPDAEMNAMRGSRIGMVVQSPMTSLDPTARIGAQLVRIQQAHGKIPRQQAEERAIAMLREVGIPDAPRRFAAWPHELSGGMAQRVLIAMALINDPVLLIADEPTTGLDVTVQAQILELLKREMTARGLATLLITHDLGIVAQYCDRVAAMFAGTIVEEGSVADVFAAPRHPYTARLIASAPDRVDLSSRAQFAGAPPDLTALPEGCVYRDRCPRAQSACAIPPPKADFGNGHAAFCHFPEPA